MKFDGGVYWFFYRVFGVGFGKVVGDGSGAGIEL